MKWDEEGFCEVHGWQFPNVRVRGHSIFYECPICGEYLWDRDPSKTELEEGEGNGDPEEDC